MSASAGVGMIFAACVVLAMMIVLLAGCAHAPTALLPTAVPCVVDAGPDPVLADTPDKLAAAANIAERVRLLLFGRGQRDLRILELKASALGCAQPLSPAAAAPEPSTQP